MRGMAHRKERQTDRQQKEKDKESKEDEEWEERQEEQVEQEEEEEKKEELLVVCMNAPLLFDLCESPRNFPRFVPRHTHTHTQTHTNTSNKSNSIKFVYETMKCAHMSIGSRGSCNYDDSSNT